MKLLCLQKIRYMNYITYIIKNKGLICGGLICGEIVNSSCLDFFWNSQSEVVVILNFTFAVFCYHGATVTLRFHNSVLVFAYISCFQKSIQLDYNDSSDVCPCFFYVFPLLFACFPTKSRTIDTLVSTIISIVPQKVGLTILWF